MFDLLFVTEAVPQTAKTDEITVTQRNFSLVFFVFYIKVLKFFCKMSQHDSQL